MTSIMKNKNTVSFLHMSTIAHKFSLFCACKQNVLGNAAGILVGFELKKVMVK